MRVAFLGPEGTFTHEALRSSLRGPVDEWPVGTVREAVIAVQTAAAERAVVPIENALEGSVRATLDTLAADAPDVRIVAQITHPIRHCLIARAAIHVEEVTRVVSHPHAISQCRAFLEARLGRAERAAATSTAEAVRFIAATGEPWAALGSSLAADRYGCTVLVDGVEDRCDNVTRFVWLAPGDDAPGAPPIATPAADPITSIVFWGFNDESPGALVDVLSELATRGVNLTRIESRPRRVRLGHYMFFADLEGASSEPAIAEALEALSKRVETLRVLGSFPAG